VVPDERVLPEGFMETTPSRCDDVVAIGTGTALLNITNGVLLRDVTWFDSDNFEVGKGIQAFNLFPGDYTAEILTNEFCEGVVEGMVSTEIHAFNLVSVNSDTKNDDWQIDCISDYPNNNVKIFNRYGVKVYEADGYDNGQVVFRGIGENGVYALGNSLPDGTYFFIIDKRDGSKPITGFLELVH
jgi:gliding motility-associated-like protein